MSAVAVLGQAKTFLSCYDPWWCLGVVAGSEVLASVRTRAEERGTTVYANAKLPPL